MRVIADLHGGDPEDLIAVAEYQEIKDRVMAEVSPSPLVTLAVCADFGSARAVKVDHMA